MVSSFRQEGSTGAVKRPPGRADRCSSTGALFRSGAGHLPTLFRTRALMSLATGSLEDAHIDKSSPSDFDHSAWIINVVWLLLLSGAINQHLKQQKCRRGMAFYAQSLSGKVQMLRFSWIIWHSGLMLHRSYVYFGALQGKDAQWRNFMSSFVFLLKRYYSDHIRTASTFANLNADYI